MTSPTEAFDRKLAATIHQHRDAAIAEHGLKKQAEGLRHQRKALEKKVDELQLRCPPSGQPGAQMVFRSEMKEMHRAISALDTEELMLNDAIATLGRVKELDHEEVIEHYFEQIQQIRSQHPTAEAQEQALCRWCGQMMNPLFF